MTSANIEDGHFYVFGDFCGNSPFWTADVLTSESPKFTACFQTTFLQWLPCIWLFTSLPVYVVFIFRRPPTVRLPLTSFSIAKSVVCLALVILTIAQALSVNQNGPDCNLQSVTPPSFYVGYGMSAFSFVVVGVAIQLVRRWGVISSAVIYLYWWLLLVCSIIPLQSTLSYDLHCADSNVVYHICYFIMIVVQTVLHSFADKRSPRDNLGDEPACPDVNVSTLSNLLYFWMTPTVIKAYKRKLGLDDLWTQTERLECNNTVGELQRQWHKEERRLAYLHREHARSQQKPANETPGNGHVPSEETPLISSATFSKTNSPTTTPPKPSLLKSLLKAFGRLWLQYNTVKIFADLAQLVQPVFLKNIVTFVENRGQPGYPLWIGIVYACLFALFGQLNTLLYNVSIQLTLTTAVRIKSALVGTIYKKSLQMGHTVKKDYTVGQIVNLMSVDCQRIQDALFFTNYILPFVTSASFGLYLIWDAVSDALPWCVLLIVVVIGLNGMLGHFQQVYQLEILQNKGIRMKLLNEVLTGIKVLKMYAWEKLFAEKVVGVRDKELGFLKKYAIVTSIANTMSVQSSFFLPVVVFLVYVLVDPSRYLDASTAFMVVSVVNVLRYPISFVPYVITGLIQCHVSVKRIEKFLWAEDLKTDNVRRVSQADHAILIQNASFTWDMENTTPILRNISMAIREGQLVAVVGLVGSGKSSLVSSMLGEMHRIDGKANIKGSIAYVPQEAWIQNMTLKDNILYGSQYRNRRYRKVIKACQLTPDLAILSAGDQTEIGQRGINLSGGQKQRVSLARAVYNNADIYLLDDPLSAVDSHVGKALFQQVISNDGLLKSKTRILVTHGVHWLPSVDTIVVMTGGRITEMGSYEQLLENNGPFSRFLQTFLLAGDSDNEEDDEVRLIKAHMRESVDQVTSDGLTSDDNIILDELKKDFEHRSALRHRTTSTTVEAIMSLTESLTKFDNTERFYSGQLTTEETTKEGAVSWRVYYAYMKAMGVGATLLAIAMLVSYHALGILLNFWVDFWTDPSAKESFNITSTTNSSGQDFTDRNTYYLTTYAIIGFCQGLTMYLFLMIYLLRMVRASGLFHASMLNCILRSPMSFFDTTPLGRILNRFASDLDVMDDRLPRTFRLLLFNLCLLLSTFLVISIQTPQFLAALVPGAFSYIVLLMFYLPTARQLKRIESVTRSPVYSHFSETITGASVIRAYGSVDRFIRESERKVDKNLSFYYGVNSASRWVGIAGETVSNCLALFAALFTVLSPTVSGGDAGLALTYASQIIVAAALCVYSLSEMEMNVVSAERVGEYTALPSEAAWESRTHRPHDTWPDDGTVRFKDYTTRYRPELELVLKGISCEIHSGEKVGIVGRTGAGKSSLTVALFRLIEATSGTITVDQARIADLGLHDLRPRITILPQDPVIFSGSVRSNLDPSNRFTDAAIWAALESAHLKQFVSEQRQALLYECGEDGMNLSLGQRQLVCLGRALLHKNKILILDEATAAVDMETDEMIQQTIKTKFQECTVLTIAHRLNTIMEYDRVMVLDNGLIAEFDTPRRLLQDKSTIFYRMARDASLEDWYDMEDKP